MATPDHAALQRVRFLSRLFDERFRLPGTNYRFGLDALLGSVPVVGDVFDIVWKANKKNVALLDEHLQRRIASNDVTYDAL
jgi:hypothetical protein